ncbi:MAG: hypothetical protein M1823_003837 [Watsoniomyces obsoletus]|nr:MAG: hypothetical protein M1823_003837 [Watsoniomyces obsoletus]
MTAQFLTAQLNSLIQESKRKNVELRNAAEKSLGELNSLPATSEAQLAGDLKRRLLFIKPFLLACGSKNAKYISIGVSCLQRLVMSRGLGKERVQEVVDALLEAISQSADVQLKILQALPSLVQYYGSELNGESLGKTLLICSELQTSRTAVVHSTAGATLQQLVVAVYDKLANEDGQPADGPTESTVSLAGKEVQQRAAAYDAYRIFEDICLLTTGQRPQLLRIKIISQTTGLELIEAVLSSHPGVFSAHLEHVEILRRHVMPLLTKVIADRSDFSSTVRAMRVFSLIVRHQLKHVSSQCEEVLGTLNRLLEPDPAAPWRRALSMELWRAIYSDFGLLRDIYARYDEKESSRKIVHENFAKLARLAAERPDLIGLGQQSTVVTDPTDPRDQSAEQVAMESAGITGMVSGALSNRTVEPQGISIQSSSMRVPCSDQLDKTEPPTVPDTYVYGLVLLCISDFSDGLAKFVLPIAMQNERRSEKRSKRTNTINGGPVVPTEEGSSTPTEEGPSTEHVSTTGKPSRQAGVKTAIAMVDTCWPAALATCSTFLYATLDRQFFRGLVRSFQKLAHVSGLVKLKTPRDAFLTTLSKAAVPHYLTSSRPTTPTTPVARGNSLPSDAPNLLSIQRGGKHGPVSSTDDLRESAVPSTVPQLNVRNLLCLRALLNLGIALGPALDEAWSIIIDTWQQADFIVQTSVKLGSRHGPGGGQVAENQGMQSPGLSTELLSEVTAVDAAGSRMLEGTAEMPHEAFADIVGAFSKLMELSSSLSDDARPSLQSPGINPPASPLSNEPSRRATKSLKVSSLSALQTHAAMFSLRSMDVLGRVNMKRMVSDDSEEKSWRVLVNHLTSWTSSSHHSSLIRLKSAEVLIGLVREAVASSGRGTDPLPVDCQLVFLEPLKTITTQLNAHTPRQSSKADIEIYRMVLEALRVALESCGDSLYNGWATVFEILDGIFEGGAVGDGEGQDGESNAVPQPISTKSSALLRPDFSSIQLICSDFLSRLPNRCVLTLIDLLYKFCAQEDDLNMSLTGITLFWNVSSFLHSEESATGMAGAGTAKTELDLRNEAVSGEKEQARTALWMVLLLRLTALAVDHRPDIRNGAIQTIFRIFDGIGDQLASETWATCLRFVVLKLIEQNAEQQANLQNVTEDSTGREADAWDETSNLIMDGIAGLFTNFSGTFLRSQELKASWATVIRYFQRILGQKRLALVVSVYRSLHRMLANVESTAQLEASLLETIWTLWLDGVPTNIRAAPRTASTDQAALLAYVQTFEEIYRLTKQENTYQQTLQVLQALYKCIMRSETSTPHGDVEAMTPLQTEVFRSVQSLRTDISGVSSALVQWLARLVALPLDRDPSRTGSRSPTFVALANESMGYMQTIVLDHLRDRSLYASGAFMVALRCLGRCISSYHPYRPSSGSTLLNKSAIRSSLKISAAAVPLLHQLNLEKQQIREVWECIVTIAHHIIRIHEASDETPLNGDANQDIDTDINALLTLRGLISPGVGSSILPDDTRRSYCRSLFAGSLIHQPQPGDIPDVQDQILEGLYDIPIGKTYDPLPSVRTKMSYVCLDELFALVAKQDGSPERVRLAQAAAPFLILRSVLPLRAFIADQPLRGRMPQPQSQRRELLYILRQLMALECEPRAIPDAPGVVSPSKKHLHRVFPLLSKAIRAARRDQELLEELCRVTDMVSEEMGISS